MRIRDIVRLHGSKNLTVGACHLARYRMAATDHAATVRDVACPVCAAPKATACTQPLRARTPFVPQRLLSEPEPETKP
jgi:hypothetical protein